MLVVMNGKETFSGDVEAEMIDRVSTYLEVQLNDCPPRTNELSFKDENRHWSGPTRESDNDVDDPRPDISPTDCGGHSSSASRSPTSSVIEKRRFKDEPSSALPRKEPEVCWTKEDSTDSATQPEEPEAYWIKGEPMDLAPRPERSSATEPLRDVCPPSAGCRISRSPAGDKQCSENKCRTESCKLMYDTSHGDTDCIREGDTTTKEGTNASSSKTGRTSSKSAGGNHTRDSRDVKLTSTSGLKRSATAGASKHPWACDQCDKTYSQRHNLVAHERVHGNGARLHACDACGSSFFRKSHLAVHTRTHTGEKPYACDRCDKRYSQKTNLVAHERSHTGDRPYVCGVCDRRFSQYNNLVTHERSHSGERPYACNLCDARFSRSSHVARHKRSHSGDKPYACDLCDASFSARNTLNRHKTSHSGEKRFACDICKSRLSSKSHLTRHRKLHLVDFKFKKC